MGAHSCNTHKAIPTEMSDTQFNYIRPTSVHPPPPDPQTPDPSPRPLDPPPPHLQARRAMGLRRVNGMGLRRVNGMGLRGTRRGRG